MRIFVTGATGLLGRNLVEHLLAQGHEVVALARNVEKSRAEMPGSIEWVAGDIENLSWTPALQGTDALVHAAALFVEYYRTGADWERFHRINVEGSIALLRQARDLGVGRLLFVSSCGALAPDGVELIDENSIQDLYRRSKIIGEKRLRAEPDLPVHIVRPSWICGPNDPAPTKTGEFARDLVLGKTVQMVTGARGPIVDARDLAIGIEKMITMPNPPAAVNFVGTNLPAIEMLEQLQRVAGCGKVQGFPFGMAAMMSRLMEVRTRLTGAVNPMPLEGLRFLSFTYPLDPKPSIEALGIQYRPFEETARDMVAYWRQRLAQK